MPSNPKDVLQKLKPGDVVIFYEKTVKDDKTTPGGQLAVLRPKMLIYQGSLPQGGGDTLLQFANAEENCGMSTSLFLGKNCILLTKDQAPEVVQRGLTYVFTI